MEIAFDQRESLFLPKDCAERNSWLDRALWFDGCFSKNSRKTGADSANLFQENAVLGEETIRLTWTKRV